jgi:hypothetical protein
MKKYTNKILIIAAAAFLTLCTISFFIKVNEIKKQIYQYETNK